MAHLTEDPVKIQRRLELYIISNNENLLRLLREDNQIFCVARCNAHTVMYADEITVMQPYQRFFIFYEYEKFEPSGEFEIFKRKAEKAGAQAFLYSWDSRIPMTQELFLNLKKNFVMDLRTIYAEIDA